MNRLAIVACALLAFAAVSHAQILNPGFESWTNGEPDDWTTSNTHPLLVNVTASSDAHSGNLSVRGEVVAYGSGLFAPYIQNPRPGYKGAGVDHRVGGLTGWVKFHSDSGDVFVISTVAAKGDSAIGGGSFTVSTEITSWDQFNLPISYVFGTSVPDTVLIACLVQGPQASNPHVGTWFELDDLAFSDAPDAVSDATPSVQSISVYPNPINASGQIRLRLDQPSSIYAALFDAAGRSAALLASLTASSGVIAIPIDASSIPDGVYVLRLEIGGRITNRTIVVAH